MIPKIGIRGRVYRGIDGNYALDHRLPRLRNLQIFVSDDLESPARGLEQLAGP